MNEFMNILLSQTSCYLIKGYHGYLLVDCGSSGDEDALLSKLRKVGLSPASIRWLFLTHHHSDHCGLLPFLLSQNSDIRIIMSRKCSEYMETGRHYHPSSERYASKALCYAFGLYRRAGGKLTDTFPAYHSREGDVIFHTEGQPLPDVVGVNGHILHTPGHTEDSFSLIVGEDAFVGDSARNILSFLGAPLQPMLLYDRAACLENWSRLLSMGVKRIHPGHGKSFDARLLSSKIKKLRSYREKSIADPQNHPFG